MVQTERAVSTEHRESQGLTGGEWEPKNGESDVLGGTKLLKVGGKVPHGKVSSNLELPNLNQSKEI